LDCIIFRGHNQESEAFKYNLDKLIRQCSKDYHIVVGYDCTNRDKFYDDRVEVFNFSADDYIKSGFPCVGHDTVIEWLVTMPEIGNPVRLIYYNIEFAQVLYWNKKRGFDNYWYFEYDVGFGGNLKDFFDNQTKRQQGVDLVCTMLRRLDENPKFKHYIDCLGGFPFEPYKHTYSMFAPVFRLSRKFIEEYYYDLLTKRIRGYCESLMPTWAMWKGLTIRDVNSAGLCCTPITYNSTPNNHEWIRNGINHMFTGMLVHPVY